MPPIGVVKLVLNFISFLLVRRSIDLGLVSSTVRAELADSLAIVESLFGEPELPSTTLVREAASQAWNLSTEAPPICLSMVRSCGRIVFCLLWAVLQICSTGLLLS
jgi:hypothetical protein